MAEERNEVGSPGGRRKFMKIGCMPKHASLSMEATIAHLKNEAASLKSNGIAQYVAEGDLKVKPDLKKVMLTYLSTVTEADYPDSQGAAYVEENAVIIHDFDEQHDEFSYDNKIGAHRANLGVENSLNLYCNLLSSLKLGTIARDGIPKVDLEKSGGNQPEKEARSKEERS